MYQITNHIPGFFLITWNSDYLLTVKCLAERKTAVGKCKCVLGVCVCVRAWVGVVYVCVCVCACVQAKVNVYCRHVWLCWRRREEGQSRDTMLLQSSSSRSCPAQITTVGPGRVILGTYLRIQVTLTAHTVHWKNKISGRVAVFFKCTDEVNSGKSYYILLMSY